MNYQFLKPQHLRGHGKKTGRWRGWPSILRVWTVGQMASLPCRLARTTCGISGLDICHTNHCLFFCLAWSVEHKAGRCPLQGAEDSTQNCSSQHVLFCALPQFSITAQSIARVRMLWSHIMCTSERAKPKILPGLNDKNVETESCITQLMCTSNLLSAFAKSRLLRFAY